MGVPEASPLIAGAAAALVAGAVAYAGSGVYTSSPQAGGRGRHRVVGR